jgi:formiminoglutamate deiminase
MIRYWAQHAWLPDGCRSGVSFAVDQDRFAEVRTGTEPGPDHRRLPGVVLPGLANGHSHAFHRALRGRTHEGGGTFWTWREEMYAVAARLEPDSYYALARQVYAEMIEAGYTCVGEFHYLHHDRAGRAYADPNAMGAALIAAAAEAGIRLTLLDSCYLAGGLDDHGHREPDPVQQRYSDGSAERWAERMALLKPTATARIGAAVHSVRAVPGAALASISPLLGDRPLHVHLSEQPAENAATLAYYGCTPTALLDEHGLLGGRTTAVHATHLTAGDVDRLGATRTAVCACPTTERDLADGIGPFRRLADAGSPLTLGSDQHAVIDPFEELRGLEMHERLSSGRRGRFRPSELIMAASVAGYRSLGWESGGEICDGALADFVVVGDDSSRTCGVAPAQIGYAATGADVVSVVVGGKVVKQP